MDVRLLAVGYTTTGSHDYPDLFRRFAAELGVDHRIEIRPPLARLQLLNLARQCPVGWAVMPQAASNVNFRHMLGASNKPFDYLACGVAVLVSELPEWREKFVVPGYGRACNPADPVSIASALQWFVDYPAETAAMGEAGRERILRDWNYETQFAPVLKVLEAP